MASKRQRAAPLFWDVATQVDFMLPGGKLYAPGAEQIIPNLARLTDYARRHHILVVSSMDAHSANDPEFQQWPPHCIVGTAGQQKIPATRLRAIVMPSSSAPLPQDLAQVEQIILEKQTVDVFTNANVEPLLARLGPRHITLYGVVTEVCVELAACDLLKRGYEVRVVTDAIRPLEERKGRETLAALQQRGAELITTDQALEI